MSQQPSADSETTANNFRHLLNVEIPTIKILFYTDDPREITQGNNLLGLRLMIEHLNGHQPAFARIRHQWVSRSSNVNNHADNKIDEILRKEEETTGKPFDEIWFFGMHQANTEKFSLTVSRGGNESELGEAEVLALENWMALNGSKGSVGGGVLMTGDHSNERPDGTIPGENPRCPDNSAGQEFLGLGRALGRCVPRAGQLRTWEGAPTYRTNDSHNTIEGSGFQTDKVPQQLVLKNVNVDGDPDPNGQPHPLFFYRQGIWIEVFPDHAHEGALHCPSSFDPEVWPALEGQPQPLPHVVACGIDKRHGTMLDLVAAYNGDRANVGRIVADSTWHHYLNINLKNFRHPAPEGSPADQIGQFYGNLALWLSPRSVRYEMGLSMLWQLADYTLLLENVGDKLSVGTAAYAILSQVASPCETHELIQAIVPERYRAMNFVEGGMNFVEGGLVLSSLPSRELLLGYILDSYHQEMIRAERTDDFYQPRGVEEVIDSGFTNAFQAQAELLGLRAVDALKFAAL
jgi:hypothetical protein